MKLGALPLPNRKNPTVRDFTVSITSSGFVLHCNSKPVKTPGDAELCMPTSLLATAIVEEWRGQGEKIDATRMPLTQLAATAIDIVGKKASDVATEVAAYAATDLLCHFADGPDVLVERQHQSWQPLLDWCAEKYGVRLHIGTGIMPIAQDATALEILRKVVAAYDPFRLTGLQFATDVSGSLLLGLALAEKHRNAMQMFDAGEIDASFQLEKWGEDPATIARRAAVRRDLDVAQRWFELLSGKT